VSRTRFPKLDPWDSISDSKRHLVKALLLYDDDDDDDDDDDFIYSQVLVGFAHFGISGSQHLGVYQ
jgi:hypothetical protein